MRTPPLFEIDETSSNVEAWNHYASAYFLTKEWEALKYNFEKITTLNNAEFNAWDTIICVCNQKKKSVYDCAKAYRKIFDCSDQMPLKAKFISKRFESFDMKSFGNWVSFYESEHDFTIFKRFHVQSPYELLGELFTFNEVDLEQSVELYYFKYILSDEFFKAYEPWTFDAAESTRIGASQRTFLMKTNLFIDSLNDILDKHVTVPAEQVRLLTTMLNISRLIESNPLSTIDERGTPSTPDWMIKPLSVLNKKTKAVYSARFPEELKLYQTQEGLGIYPDSASLISGVSLELEDNIALPTI